MGIPGGRKTKTGYSTAADILEKLAPEQPVVNDILDRLKLRFLESEFLIGDVNNLWKTRIVIIFGTKVKR